MASTTRRSREIVKHLEAAHAVPTAPMAQARSTRSSRFYRTGEAADREAYDIAWVEDKASPVDTINGFIEVYLDARGVKGAWESARLLRQPGEDRSASRRWRPTRSGSRIACRGIRSIASPACRASTANAIDVVVETGDSGPVTPIGINLPNDQAIREKYGSKSVSLVERQRGLRTGDARRCATSSRGRRRKPTRATKLRTLAGELTTDMHEVIGHASGRQAEG